MTQPSEQSKDIRLKVTSRIWAFATGMLAICIPLSAATKSGPVIPIAVIAGAAIGTTSVWRSDRKSGDRLENSHKIEKLEGRIADLEAIIATQDIDLQRRIESSTKNDSPILPKSF
jgi:hypothetical protein